MKTPRVSHCLYRVGSMFPSHRNRSPGPMPKRTQNNTCNTGSEFCFVSFYNLAQLPKLPID